MVRPPCFDSNGMKKGAWSEEEDNRLRAFVMKYGHWNWRLLPRYAGLARCGKSCRLRWVNYLQPGLKKGNFSKEEEDLIIKLHSQVGNKWSAIATKLPGRTDNEIKNYWHAHINKRRKQINPAIKKVVRHTGEASSDDQVTKEEKASSFTLCETTRKIQESELVCGTDPSVFPNTQPQVDLWPDVFLADTNCSQNGCLPPLLEEEFLYLHELHYRELSSADSASNRSALDWINAHDDHSIISSEYVAQPVGGNFLTEYFPSNTSNSQNGSSYIPPPQEVGGFYDPFFEYFDYGMNLFS